MAAITMTEQQIKRVFVGLRPNSTALYQLWIDFILQINADTGGVLDQTYAEVSASQIGGTLIPGQWYRITDFRTTFDIPNDPGGGQSIGPIAPLVVKASAVDSLENFAMDATEPTDLLEYSLQDALFGALTGRITRRIDSTNNNEAPFDFRVCEFIRFETSPASGIFTVIFDNGGASQLANAWSVGTGGADGSNILILPFKNAGSVDLMPNIVIEDGSTNITFGTKCLNITLRSSCRDIVVGEESLSLTFGTSCSQFLLGPFSTLHTFGNTCRKITIGQDCDTITLGDFNEDITIGNGGTTIITGDNCSDLTFGNSCGDHFLGAACQRFSVANGCFSNTFGDSNTNFTIQGQCNTNSFGNICDSVKMYHDASGHLVGASCNNLTFGQNTSGITIDTLATNVHIGDSVTSLTIAAGSEYRHEELTYGENYYSWSFANDGGAVSDIVISNIPNNATGVFGLLQALTQPVTGSGNAMLAVGIATDGPEEILNSTINNNAIFTSGAWEAMTIDWSTFTTQTTAARDLIFRIANNALINGLINFKIRYEKEF